MYTCPPLLPSQSALASLEQCLNQVSLSLSSPALLAQRDLSDLLTVLKTVQLVEQVLSLSGLDALLLELTGGGLLELLP